MATDSITPAAPARGRRTSIIFEEGLLEDLGRLAKVWGAVHGRRWPTSDVVRHLLREGLDLAWREAGGRATTEAEIRRAAATLTAAVGRTRRGA